MTELPSGTVTFLFTDIVGGTGLWEAHGHAMPAAYARHDELLRGVIEGHGGAVYKTIGDAFQAAFADAGAAVAATLAAQRALAAEPWALPSALRIRTVLHTCDVEPAGGRLPLAAPQPAGAVARGRSRRADPAVGGGRGAGRGARCRRGSACATSASAA